MPIKFFSGKPAKFHQGIHPKLRPCSRIAIIWSGSFEQFADWP